ncbi:hypothetical protein IAD21_03848 [Abditibacteriota bacterium]|nr:hypothetical protein IAD21_03848 [Abditibacteriota bacterium]
MPLFASRPSGSKRVRWLLPLTLLGAFIVFAKMTNTNPPTNSARTSPQEGELQTRVYETVPDLAAKDFAQLTLSTYGRSWKLVETNHISKNEVQLVFHVPVVVFTDILTVTVRQISADESEVNVESHSQIGQGDFGENRRHVLQILSVLDDRYSQLPS